MSDPLTHTMTVTDPAGRIERTTFDRQGHRLTTKLSGLAATSYGYDELGRVVSVTQGIGVDATTALFKFDDQRGVMSMTDPSGGVWTTSVDAAERIRTLTLPGDRTVTLSYDLPGHTKHIKPPGRQPHVVHLRPDGLLDLSVAPGGC